MRIINEALSEDEFMKRAQENEKIYNSIKDKISTLDKALSETRYIFSGWRNAKMKPYVQIINDVCKEIMKENKEFKEMS